MRFLAFEWSAPPRYPKVRGQRYQVLLHLAPAEGGQTHLVLTALGFGTGQLWRDVHAYFERAWDAVLQRLKASLE